MERKCAFVFAVLNSHVWGQDSESDVAILSCAKAVQLGIDVGHCSPTSSEQLCATTYLIEVQNKL
jgi:hypothetical protein